MHYGNTKTLILDIASEFRIQTYIIYIKILIPFKVKTIGTCASSIFSSSIYKIGNDGSLLSYKYWFTLYRSVCVYFGKSLCKEPAEFIKETLVLYSVFCYQKIINGKYEQVQQVQT